MDTSFGSLKTKNAFLSSKEFTCEIHVVNMSGMCHTNTLLVQGAVLDRS